MFVLLKSPLAQATCQERSFVFILRVPRVTEQYREARRDEIADAALRAFRRKGFQATSMAEIITESGLSAGAIYGHFPSKSAIAVHVATRIIDARVLDIERLAELSPCPPRRPCPGC